MCMSEHIFRGCSVRCDTKFSCRRANETCRAMLIVLHLNDQPPKSKRRICAYLYLCASRMCNYLCLYTRQRQANNRLRSHACFLNWQKPAPCFSHKCQLFGQRHPKIIQTPTNSAISIKPSKSHLNARNDIKSVFPCFLNTDDYVKPIYQPRRHYYFLKRLPYDIIS